jgi:hypothetical protein
MPPHISISDLYELKNKKDRSRINTFNIILNKCHDKIKKIAEQGGMSIFFEIPFFTLGFPLYNVEDCVEYITDALKKNGLLVQILPKPNNNTIYISWKPNDVTMKKRLTTSKPF